MFLCFCVSMFLCFSVSMFLCFGKSLRNCLRICLRSASPKWPVASAIAPKSPPQWQIASANASEKPPRNAQLPPQLPPHLPPKTTAPKPKSDKATARLGQGSRSLPGLFWSLVRPCFHSVGAARSQPLHAADGTRYRCIASSCPDKKTV